VAQLDYSIQVDEILLAVGRALHNWSRVEEAIVDILWRCMETKSVEPAVIVWDSIRSIPPKLKIVSDMIPLLVSDQHANELWADLSNAIVDHNQIKRTLVQYQIVRFADGPRLAPEFRRWENEDDANDDADEPKPTDTTHSYSAAEINDAAKGFIELKENLVWYCEWVLEFKRIPQEYATPPPSIIRAFLERNGPGD
jgi:hypothetical protein